MKKSRKVGILGGGQLAKMLCDSGKKMGYETIVLDPSSDSCGRFGADEHIVANYDDESALKRLCKESDVITYEFENVPSKVIDFLKRNGGNVPQGERPLYLSQHRVREKSAVNEIGVRTADFAEVNSLISAKEALIKIEAPCILKTCSGGYDGKGQWKIQSESDLNDVDWKDTEYILEKMVDFQKEVSCLVVRGINGDIVTFPVGENIHKNGILNKTIVPARISEDVQRKIENLSKRIVEKLDIYGPLGIEYFIKGEEVYFNEMAPRPHNSAHYTMDACNYSQFDVHLLGVLGEKLPEIKLLTPVVMLNIMGEDREKIEKITLDENTKLHIYGKTEWKKDRKMGHINYCGESIEKLIEKANSF
ncbi:5-(carboxyamino)imidazole ribonucleotide synthase [Cetobacterium sp.]|uniref:5-(carboxyamino)imidazole ribonucleotide synthase n=1 Tax=Cetobacterium sp. TaxID=2071632 RepID=UPI003F37AAEC